MLSLVAIVTMLIQRKILKLPHYLSKYIASERLVQMWLAFNKLKEVHATTVLLHDHLKELTVFKHVQHLKQLYTIVEHFSEKFYRHVHTDFQNSEQKS